MKTLRCCLKDGFFFLVSVIVLACGSRALAQTAAPIVSISSPTNGAIFYTPTNIQLIAETGSSYGATNVEFFAGTNDLGPGIPEISGGIIVTVYFLTWTNPPVGEYALTAVGMSPGGISITSAPVNISVLQGPPPSPPPLFSVRIVSPPNGAVFYAPVDIPLLAYVYYDTNSWMVPAGVGFYDGTNLIGIAQPVPLPAPVVPAGSSDSSNSNSIPTLYSAHLFSLVWTNAPVGNHVLTAQVGLVGRLFMLAIRLISPPVDIAVLPPQPPPTNRPPIVDIVATDPVAIESTNSWLWPGETNSPPTWAAWPPAVCDYFTNYGPKTATFTVRRYGETNDDLTVTYSIGGTASNGTDYVALPGYAIIPAAERRAFITIIPIDTISPGFIKTVILTLTPSTNTPPGYLVGYPPRAAAIIVDSPGICPVASMTSDNCFHLSMPGPDAAWFSVECSTDLVNWLPICTNQVINGSIDFIDPDAPNYFSRYYRVIPLADTPPAP